MYAQQASAHLRCASSEVTSLQEKLEVLAVADRGLAAQLDSPFLSTERLNEIMKSRISLMAKAYFAVVSSLHQLTFHLSACATSLASVAKLETQLSLITLAQVFEDSEVAACKFVYSELTKKPYFINNLKKLAILIPLLLDGSLPEFSAKSKDFLTENAAYYSFNAIPVGERDMIRARFHSLELTERSPMWFKEGRTRRERLAHQHLSPLCARSARNACECFLHGHADEEQELLSGACDELVRVLSNIDRHRAVITIQRFAYGRLGFLQVERRRCMPATPRDPPTTTGATEPS
jgi:hypothetical protein